MDNNKIDLGEVKVPESWDDITFNTTGYDTTVDGYDYGHLVLSY